MPQRSLHPLVYILLMWLTIISIVQVVFIAFFFTLGQNGQSSSHRAEEPGGTNVPLVAITSPMTKTKTISEQGTVLNYKASGVKQNNIEWSALKPIPNMISDKGEQLHVKIDGYYFLSLWVTLPSCKDIPDSECLEHTVKLRYGSNDLMKGRIDRKTHSSGQLSRVKGLSAGDKLQVIIDPPPTTVCDDETVTHLDIVFIRCLDNVV